MASKKYRIQVRRYPAGETHYSTDEYEVIETIKVTLTGEAIGNFNPLYCRYKGERMLVFSDAGDLSDPFRREDSYADSLFVKIPA